MNSDDGRANFRVGAKLDDEGESESIVGSAEEREEDVKSVKSVAID